MNPELILQQCFFLLVQGDISTMLTFWKCNKNLGSDVLSFDH